MQIASVLQRLIGALIDRVFLIMIFVWTLGILSTQQSLSGLVNTGLIILSVWIILIPLIPLFQSFLTSHYGGSVGKLLSGMVVQTTAGERITFSRAFFRNYVGSVVSGLFLGLGFLWILKDKNRQAWHDMMADTIVVKSRPSGIILGIFILIGIIVASSAGGMMIYRNLVANAGTYQIIIDDLQSQIAPELSLKGDDLLLAPESSGGAEVEFEDPNIESVLSNATNITLSDYPQGLFSSDPATWGLINYADEPIVVTIFFKQPVNVSGIVAEFSSCTDEDCYVWQAFSQNAETGEVKPLFDSIKTKRDEIESTGLVSIGPVTTITLNIERIGGPDNYIHLKKIKFLYE